MNVYLLSSKLAIPRKTATYVHRPRILNRLNRFAGSKLTIVAAPAGFGKTTVVSDWIETHSIQAAWVSLETGDNAFLRFWSYVVAAIERIHPGFAEKIKPIFQSFTDESIEHTLSFLLNELAQLPESFVIVLDDYHVIEDATIHESISFLLEHLPESIRLLLISRSVPPLPFSRLRVRNQLVELDSNDLRFTLEEVRALHEKVVDFSLSNEELEMLEKKTEGWAAGLLLAFLSLSGQRDSAAFIQSFSGSQRYVLDYLVDEVLSLQTEGVQSFLLQSSILTRMNAPLSQAVTGVTDTASLLTLIEQANLFFIPLDDTGTWYRYHHLFAETLQNRLQKKVTREQIAHLHRRAHRWYNEAGEYGEAIHHALEAGDFDIAASYMEKSFPLIVQNGEGALLLRWLEKLPLHSMIGVPNLVYFQVTRLAAHGRAGEARRYLGQIETLIQTKKMEIPAERVNELETKITLYRASIAYYQHDIDTFLQLVAANLEGVQQFGQIVHVMNLGEAMLYRGPIGFGGKLSKMAYLSSKVSGSERTRALLHQVLGGYAPIFLADMQYEWNLLSDAETNVEQAMQYAHSTTQQVGVLTTGYILQARVKRALGRRSESLILLQRAIDEMREKQALRWQLLLEATLVRHHLAEGNVEEGVKWVAKRHMQTTERPMMSREYENITLARVLMAQQRMDEAKEWLQRLLLGAEQADRVGSRIELLILLALCSQAKGNLSEAVVPLEKAMDLAESEGYIRIFLDEGQQMEGLLAHVGRRVEKVAYSQKLLPLFASNKSSQPPAFYLTNREKEVLQYISEGLSNQEISDRLTVTLGTTKKYIHTIFQKLDVKNRVQAITKGKEMKL